MRIGMKNLMAILIFALAIPLLAIPPSPYKELRIPKPADWRHCSEEEFQIDLSRLEVRDKGMIYGTRDGLLKLARFYKENPDGQRLWKSQQKGVARIVNDWYFQPANLNSYVYQCWQLASYGFVYTLTGHQLLGEFVHDHVMQIVRLPEDFWLHKELRSYRPERPYGMIETGQTSRMIVSVVSGAEDLFTDVEIAEINQALQKKALVPMLNYLEDTKAVNNFLAIVGIGTYITGKYLNDPKACETAKSALLRYVNSSVEDDGSYGEGTGYFNYPAGGLVHAVAAMSPAEQKSFFEQSGLRHSSEWLAYPYLYSSVSADSRLRCVYADNSYLERPSIQFLAMISDIYGDPVANYLGKKFSVIAPSAWQCGMWVWGLAHMSSEKSQDSSSPGSLDSLPLVRGFENGENFIRSSWNADSIVLSLYTAGPTRIKYAHQRPERNSINLGAYGEYFIVSPHSASYRSPIHDEYDRSTLSANTIRIDNHDQLTPNRPAWGLKNPPYATLGKPVGKLVQLKSNSDFDVLTGDARQCYKEKLKEASRTVLYRRSQNYFVVVDRLADQQSLPHTYTALWHFNNRDEKLQLSGETSENMLVERPRANLAVFTGADCKLERTITDGYMHGPKRDYFPGGPNEGKPGSAKVLNVSNSEPRTSVTLVTVLQPLRKDETPRPVSWQAGKLQVGDDTWSLDEKSIRLGENSALLVF